MYGRVRWEVGVITAVVSALLIACGGGGNSGSPGGPPQVEVLISSDPASGSIYIANLIPNDSPGWATYTPYLMIVDNAGNATFTQDVISPVGAFDFKLQPNGRISFFTVTSLSLDGYLTATDLNHQVTGIFRVPDGPTDVHDSMMLPNGHVIMLSPQPFMEDLTAYGGSASATVIDGQIVEIDVAGNVVFQWRARDHVQVEEATPDINIRAATVDYVHANSIDLDRDGNLILSCWHLDQVMKIDHQTGAILWRLGGKNNDFVFVNDPFNGPSHQHCARILPSGNLLMFDNGNLHTPPESRVVEYQLDFSTAPPTATVVWQYRNTPPIFSAATGSAQRLANGNTLIGWGLVSIPAVTEVTPDGIKALELALPHGNISYRAFKF